MASTPGPRILIIGAGSRGNAYARAVTQSTNGIIAAVAEPLYVKRTSLGRKYIEDFEDKDSKGQSFADYRDFILYEAHRRKETAAGKDVLPGIDGVFVCTLDHMHAEIIVALQGLKGKMLHIMCEKPLATTWEDCQMIKRALTEEDGTQQAVFGIGHVLHYSPHNILLRRLVVEEEVVGEVVSMEHTEPVGYWHFAHSYVRGNWRKESISAPSLMTKSCHDIDLILWLLCSASRSKSRKTSHQPRYISSSGSLSYFRGSKKPADAGSATNCLECNYEPDCIYSAKRIYLENHLRNGVVGWPVTIVCPDIEEVMQQSGQAAAEERLLSALKEDYDVSEITREASEGRPWFGRCVWESDNDVCDNQVVTMEWLDDPRSNPGNCATEGKKIFARGAKTATFNMIAFTDKQCERRGRIYGSKGEISYDSQTIEIHDFASATTKRYKPKQPGGGHGGGDDGLARQFVGAIEAVEQEKMNVNDAQDEYIGCTLDDVLLSHGMVFAAEEARTDRKVVDCDKWLLDHR